MKDFQTFFKSFTFLVQKGYLVSGRAPNNNFKFFLTLDSNTELFFIGSVKSKRKHSVLFWAPSGSGCAAWLLCLEGMHIGHKSKCSLSKTALVTLSSTGSLLLCVLLAIAVSQQKQDIMDRSVNKNQEEEQESMEISEAQRCALFTSLGHILSVFGK